MTYFTANDQVGTAHFTTGDTLNIRCIASGTPKPTMSLLDNQGVVLYVSDFAGTLAFTVYDLDCTRSNEYTCRAHNGFSVSDTIVSVGKCPSEPSSFDFLPVKIAVPLIGLVGVLIVAVCCCTRWRSKGKRQTPERATEVGPRGFPQMADGMHARPGPHQQTPGTIQNHMSRPLQNGACRSDIVARPDLTRDEAFLIGMHDGDKGALFLILATSKQNPSMDLQQNSSNTLNGQKPWSHVNAPITSSAAYDVASFPPPQYTEIPTQQATPGPYNSQTLEYRLGYSMDV
ncbi:unnamed protein product [Lymnaea stagnalis]|uniref:Ig-like domain-containing protein n=1 Tax=Lymnaea stagnalis TaxID=6523 RepID=A0AAV2HMS3_LYMST